MESFCLTQGRDFYILCPITEEIMLKASKLTIDYLKAQEDKSALATRLDCSRRTLSSIEDGDDLGHADMVAKILKETGFEFEKAFEVKE